MQLAVFVLARRVGVKLLEELFERRFGKTPLRHTSWMWYTAMQTSELGHLWDQFAGQHNAGVSLSDCLRWLKLQASLEEWKTFSRRLGCGIFTISPLLRPNGYHERTTRRCTYWTRGGVWHHRSNFTRIIIFGEHLERDHSYNKFTRALSDSQTRQLEREVQNFVSPEQMLQPDAVLAGVSYVQSRIPELLGWHTTVGLHTVSWFFQCPVPFYDERGEWVVDWRLPKKRTPHTHLSWFPHARRPWQEVAPPKPRDRRMPSS